MSYLAFVMGWLLTFGIIRGETIPPSADLLPRVKSVLQSQENDYYSYTVRKLGNRKVELEGFVSLDADWNTIQTTAKKVSDYPKWIFPRINFRGKGESFYLLFNSMELVPEAPQDLKVEIALAIPAIKISVKKNFHFEFLPQANPNQWTLTTRIVDPSDSAVESFSGYAHFYRPPHRSGRVWCYLNLSLVFNSWVIYESLPERLLSTEAGERLRILMESYQTLESSP